MGEESGRTYELEADDRRFLRILYRCLGDILLGDALTVSIRTSYIDE